MLIQKIHNVSTILFQLNLYKKMAKIENKIELEIHRIKSIIFEYEINIEKYFQFYFVENSPDLISNMKLVLEEIQTHVNEELYPQKFMENMLKLKERA